jgi:hypothetical protein
MSDGSQIFPRPDNFLALDLGKRQFSVRSFALSGQPYFEVNGAAAQTPEPIVEDIISGRLTGAVLALFDGIDIGSLESLPCFVTDERQSIGIRYKVTLGSSQSADLDFRPGQGTALTASVSYDDSLVVEAMSCEAESRERMRR